MRKKLIAGLVFLFFIGVGVTLYFRESFLKHLARFLVSEDDWQRKTYDYAVIPGGQPIERGLFAAKLFHEGRVKHIVCLGGNYPKILRLTEDTCSEGRLSAVQLLMSGVPDSCISVLSEGTSTQEELKAFTSFIHEKPGTVLMITSRFHTRRARRVLRKLLKGFERSFDVAGAPPLLFDENNWWRSEEGLITINNEYLKGLYYLYKY